MVKNRVENWIIICAVTLAWAAPVGAISQANKCEAVKNKLAGKYAFCRQTAEAKAVKSGEPLDLSKCDEKYSANWMKAEEKGDGSCPSNGDLGAIRAFISQHTDDVATALAGGGLPQGCRLPASGQTTPFGAGSDGAVQAGLTLSYTDNGDGTITDNNTGLMWEKKDDSGGIHDLDNTYTWCGASCGSFAPGPQMDGTLATTFLAILNGGFAGYTDWRIPNVKELQSIMDYESRNISIDAPFVSSTCAGCTDVTAATCSCTARGNYWSSTTYLVTGQSLDELAWSVSFGGDGTIPYQKESAYYARAVRGGS